MSRLRDQQGIAMPVALIVMMITLLLAGVAVEVAIHTNRLSNRDTSAKAALQASDAGLRVASYRLNIFRPDATHCPTNPATTVGASNICAQVGPEALGNGASYQYWVSGPLSSTDICAGSTVSNGQNAIAQRCVTSAGLIGGVVRTRTQARIAAYNSQPVFPTAIYGTKSVTISNSSQIVGTVQNPALLGTNGTLTVGNAQINGYSVPPGATVQLANGTTNTGPVTTLASPWPTLTPVNPGTSWQNTTYPGGTCGPPAPTPQTNCDYRIANGLDSVTGAVVFDPIGRVLALGNNSSVTLAGGVYNFCNLTMSNGSAIYIAPGARTVIYIDSPSDPNSGSVGSVTNPPCAPGTGTFSMAQNAALNPGVGSAALNAQVYVYGTPGSLPPSLASNSVTLSNNSNSAYLLDAPYSAVTLVPSTNSTFTGAIAGYTVSLGNASTFTYEPAASTLQANSLGVYYRTYWVQCTTLAPTADPRSGC